MTDHPEHDRPDGQTSFGEAVGAKAARKLKARRHAHPGVWIGLGMIGLVGWSVTVPTLVGTAFGIWLDNRHPGSHSWTLTFLIIGLAIGCLNAWHWIDKEDKAMQAEQKDSHE